MTEFDSTLHPRQTFGNTGLFAEKENTGPEGGLPAAGGFDVLPEGWTGSDLGDLTERQDFRVKTPAGDRAYDIEYDDGDVFISVQHLDQTAPGSIAPKSFAKYTPTGLSFTNEYDADAFTALREDERRTIESLALLAFVNGTSK